jgi:hypothetical protein
MGMGVTAAAAAAKSGSAREGLEKRMAARWVGKVGGVMREQKR